MRTSFQLNSDQRWPGATAAFDHLLFAASLVLALLTVEAADAAPQSASVTNLDPTPFPGTALLTLQGDLASNLVAGADRFLLRKLAESTQQRAKFWHRDFSSPEAYNRSLQTNRQRLAHILGARDARVPFDALQLDATTAQPALAGRGDGFEAFAVRWPAFGDVHGEGLLLVPMGRAPIADVVAVPDAEQTPEQLAGLADGLPPEQQFARRLSESGCRVLVPVLINRNMGPHKGRAKLTAREFLYRSAFELGRQLVAYETQKILAAVDWFSRQSASGGTPKARVPVGVIGWGEGGMLALYAAALDDRIGVACVSGFFNDLGRLWEEPIDRNVFGLLEQFGGAELAAMVAPRTLILEAARSPEITVTGQGGGAPARLVTPRLKDVRAEIDRALKLVEGLSPPAPIELVVSGADGAGPFASAGALQKFLGALAPDASLRPPGRAPESLRPQFDPAARHARQMHEIDRHNQALLVESPYLRQEFMKKLDTSSLDKFNASVEWYRDFFRHEVIGSFEEPRLAPMARTRKAYETPAWTGYEVVLDVFPDLIAYGVLLMPKNVATGERRPVVVCQHGLEGRPRDVIAGDHYAYHDFAAKLAERGFITFAPQNLYLFTDRFRTLQRKANPLKKTLFSLIVPQHQQIVDWLITLPAVDPARIAFYGLSYGGKSAMRIPPLVTNYCLSICSADFNEWVWKNASSRSPYSYVWTGEYEIFEFDLGSTFNYAEMAALIAPRPFMVERGHFDGVAPDEAVAHEFGKVRFLYQGKLGLGDRCELETFAGPHTIHGRGTFDFLHKHLRWSLPNVE